MANLRPHGTDEVGCEKRWVSLSVLGQDDGSLPTLREDKENLVAFGVCMVVWEV